MSYLISHYNPKTGIRDIASHTIYVVRENFNHKWRYLLLKVNPKDKFSRKKFTEKIKTDTKILSAKSVRNKLSEKILRKISKKKNFKKNIDRKNSPKRTITRRIHNEFALTSSQKIVIENVSEKNVKNRANLITC